MGFRRVAGVRSLVITGYTNYLVFWREHVDYVEIVRILHGMQNLPRFFRRAN
jgi:plasmid stabilization system protein ParE